MVMSNEELEAELILTKQAIDMGWQMSAGVLVFFMNAGFALLESGTVRFKNFQNILLKNVMHALVGGLIWWAWGFAFAYGDVDGGFIGTKYFVGTDLNADKKYAEWWFQYAFAATAATIVSGSLAERINVYCYITFAFFMIGFIYPIITAWTWGGGFLAAKGFYDFAGSGIVHMTGGFAGLIGSAICGPRLGRFGDYAGRKATVSSSSGGSAMNQIGNVPSAGNTGSYSEIHKKFMSGEIEIEHVHAFVRSYQMTLDERRFGGSNVSSVTLGTLILWVGWFFFNGGSSLGLSGTGWEDGSLAIVNTVIAPCACGLFTFLTRKHITGQNKEQRLDFGALTNGLLAGCVSITAGCGAVEPWAAIIIGIFGSVFYSLACLFMEKVQIDDPLEAFQVHGVCGFWGVIAVAFFTKEKGIVYGHADSGTLFLWQLVGALCIMGWSMLLTGVYFLIAKKLGVIRLNAEEELLGGDIHYFAPIQFEGKISTYATGLQLTRLNSEAMRHKDLEMANTKQAINS